MRTTFLNTTRFKKWEIKDILPGKWFFRSRRTQCVECLQPRLLAPSC